MKLMTKELEEKFKKYPLGSQDKKGYDAEIIVKYFNPAGAGTWLITEGQKFENNDYELFGYCELGNDYEWGSVLLSELESLELPYGLKIERVLNMSLKFAKKENADINVVSLIALLHDVDDYKLFGIENANNLTNAKKFMNNANVSLKLQKKVLSELSCIGYSRAMKGIRPKTIEGMVVSDADMCDCLGVTGILRTYKFSLKYGKPFFGKSIFPIDNIDFKEYSKGYAVTSVCYIFEKILKLKYLMMTDSGKEEAINRHKIVVDVLYHLFEEENVPEWKEYLDSYIRKLEKR